MPYAAPIFYLAPLTAAYPTPPPSPLGDITPLPLDDNSDKVFWSSAAPFSPPISADPYLAAVAPLPQRSSPRPPIRHRASTSQLYTSTHSSSSPLRLSPPGGILAVLGGVRVLRIDAGSVLDRMPYTGSSAASMGVTSAADTDVVDALIASEQRAADIAAEVARIDAGVLSLRRAQSESTVQQASTTKTVVPTVSLPPVDESPASATDADKKRASPRSPRSPARLISRPVRMPSPSNINIIPNVLPEVRSPRRSTESLQTRRSRRPKLFGFTLVEEPQSAPPSARGSPECPSSSSEHASLSTSSSSTSNMLPRRNPIRVRSETSLTSLAHTAPPPKRNTGLKLDLGPIIATAAEELPLTSGVVSSPYHSVIKKKSGEIVKSALKQGGPLYANGTPVEKRPYHGSRSCPTTPSCPKYVHFDTQLERVKLFLQNQKPQVVSRQGSPTDELSENEADAEDESAKKILTIRLPNFPTSQDVDTDMFLESLFLNDDRDALRGCVRVKNLAFQKSVVVRFTFDWWQTTSEVTATYKESIRGGLHDRFQFTLKLTDLLDTIQDKMLFLCVRYTTDGREIWDSNGGANYQVLFEKKALVTPKYMPKRSVPSPSANGMGKSVNRSGSPWSVTGNDADRMADLRAKLNRLTAEDRELNKPLSPVKRSFTSPRSSPRASTVRLPSTGNEAADLPAMSSLSSRYDFGSALKSSRKTSPQIAKRELQDRHAAKDFYSPRPGHFQLPGGPSSPNASSPLAGGPASPGIPESPIPAEVAPQLTFASNNSSSSTSLDSVAATPADSPSLSLHSLRSAMDHDVTPSDTTDSLNSSSASSTVSMSPGGGSSPLSPTDVFPWSSHGGKDRSADDMSLASYSSFIEQFCWAGGAPDKGTNVRRIHSTSSLDHYFSSPPDALTPRAYTPTYGLSRSASASGNGTAQSATPSGPQRRASPPTIEDLEHVDNAIRSLSNSLASTPISGSPSISPPMTRLTSTGGTVLAI